jgi:hypothetical protein
MTEDTNLKTKRNKKSDKDKRNKEMFGKYSNKFIRIQETKMKETKMKETKLS